MKQRGGASRLIDWTGERFVPWVGDSQLAYEHLHRYALARTLVDGLTVLDLASGEGFGAAVLGAAAHEVLGVDVDVDAVRHASANYAGPNVSFLRADARTLDGVEDDSIDVVVAFEMIEHVREHDQVMSAVRRVLRPGGLLLMSTPNRRLYRADDEPNPFHRRELDESEFRGLLEASFSNVALLSQRAHAGSRIESLDGDAAGPELCVRFERSADTWVEVAAPPPYYMLGVACDESLPPLPVGSTLVDPSLDVVRGLRESLSDARSRVAGLEQALADERARWQSELADAAAKIESAEAGLAGAVAQERDRTQESILRERELAASRIEEERRRARAELGEERRRGADRLAAARAAWGEVEVRLRAALAEEAERTSAARAEERRRHDELSARAESELQRATDDLAARLAAQERRADAAEERVASLHAELVSARAACEAREAAVAEGERRVDVERAARAAAEELSRRAARELDLRERELAALEERVARVTEDAGQAHLLAARVQASVTWRAIERLRRYLYRGDGRPNPAGRIVSRALLGVHSRLGSTSSVGASVVVPAAAPGRLVVPTSDLPVASLVIPAYGAAPHLHQCLRALARAGDEVAFEVLVVDDDPADRSVEELMGTVDGVRYVRNETNLGYLRSVNRGAEFARGEFVVTLNSDTEPQPGWLEAMVARCRTNPRAAAVGGRLIYPTGALQEAGGVVFRDGSAANYGNGESPHDPRFTFARPVDYCSAAAILVRRAVWEELGGFDEAFAPAYYEDTDLCFRVREAGHEVWYEPLAVVTHYEGVSHGTDVSAGVKRHQAMNRAVFARRHRDALRAAAARDGDLARRRAADRRTGPAVLVYDGQVPEPDRDSGSLRMFTMLAEMAAHGARVVFVPADGRDRASYRIQLERLGIEVADAQRGRPFHDELRQRGATLDVVILCRPLLAAAELPFVREFAPRARVVFDTVDLHFAREAGRFSGRPPRSETVPAAYREIEFGLMRAADLTFVVSDDERALLADAVPGVPVTVVPNAHSIRDGVPPGGEREGYLFVGGFRHHPNVDAVDWLAEEIWPAVTGAVPGATLHVVGPDGPDHFDGYRSHSIDVVGWVEDIDPYLDGCMALVAPLRYGAGMKGKVSQALACGLPVITTAIGAQGLGLTHGVDVLIAETPAEFAHAVACLESEDGLWERLSDNGRVAARRVCSVETVRGALAELLRPTR